MPDASLVTFLSVTIVVVVIPLFVISLLSSTADCEIKSFSVFSVMFRFSVVAATAKQTAVARTMMCPYQVYFLDGCCFIAHLNMYVCVCMCV